MLACPRGRMERYISVGNSQYNAAGGLADAGVCGGGDVLNPCALPPRRRCLIPSSYLKSTVESDRTSAPSFRLGQTARAGTRLLGPVSWAYEPSKSGLDAYSVPLAGRPISRMRGSSANLASSGTEAPSVSLLFALCPM